jgi:hypothetical protein
VKFPAKCVEMLVTELVAAGGWVEEFAPVIFGAGAAVVLPMAVVVVLHGMKIANLQSKLLETQEKKNETLELRVAHLEAQLAKHETDRHDSVDVEKRLEQRL